MDRGERSRPEALHTSGTQQCERGKRVARVAGKAGVRSERGGGRRGGLCGRGAGPSRAGGERDSDRGRSLTDHLPPLTAHQLPITDTGRNYSNLSDLSGEFRIPDRQRSPRPHRRSHTRSQQGLSRRREKGVGHVGSTAGCPAAREHVRGAWREIEARRRRAPGPRGSS